jgi:hypothetical protein
MIEGVFIGPGQPVGGTPIRFPSAVLPRLSADPTHDTSFACLDLVQVATVNPPDDWAWAVLSEAGTYTWGHTIGLNLGEPWRFGTWAFAGGPRVYAVAYAPLIAPSDISASYGPDAATCARSDYKAVQLTLTRIP